MARTKTETDVALLNAPTRIGMSKETRSLRCKLTTLAKAEVLARSFNELEDMEARHKSARADMKEAEDDQAGIVKSTAYDVRTGTEARDTECEWIADFETAKVELVRLDTDDVVQSRDLTDHDRQLALNVSGSAGAP